MPRKLTTQEFIEKAQRIHNNKYDYSKCNYTGTYSKVIIVCPIHGEFEQTPVLHLQGQECPKCAHRSYKLTTKEWIQKAIEVHGDKYDYSQSSYVDSKTKIKIICPIHGEFWQLPNNHLRTNGCPKCGKQRVTSNTVDFVQKAIAVHGNKYQYNSVIYKNNATKVSINCPIHGNFLQTPNCHLSGCGCPKCNTSKGEKIISSFLEENSIEYVTQYEIAIDTNINPSGIAKIDFFLPQLNIAIEYNGIQHYKKIPYFELGRTLEVQQTRDKYIRKYCLEKGIKLIEIPYHEDVNKYLNFLKNEN